MMKCPRCGVEWPESLRVHPQLSGSFTGSLELYVSIMEGPGYTLSCDECEWKWPKKGEVVSNEAIAWADEATQGPLELWWSMFTEVEE